MAPRREQPDAPAVAIVQARMSSRRLPGKVLRDIAGKPMLQWVVERLRWARTVDAVHVATSVNPGDDPIVAFCQENGIECFRGSEDDVLDRFYQLARQSGVKTIVRITGDCPLIDPQVVDRVVGFYRGGRYDYVTNTLESTYPDGQDVEVFSFEALERAWNASESRTDREHVTPYLRRDETLHLGNVRSETPLQDHRWTVDEADDLSFVQAIYDRLGGADEPFAMESVLAILAREPALMEMNAKTIRNEGYYRTIAEQPPLAGGSLKLDVSHELKQRAARRIPSCTQTFSKGPTQFVQGASPVFLQRGEGSRVWDPDGNEYIDYSMALGAVILGHNHPGVSRAVVEQLREGTTFSLPHPIEVAVAEILSELVPTCEMVRFGKNGSDATSGAVRLARAHTGRDIVACCGYHGWQDWYIGTTTRALGVPEAVRRLTRTFRYNDIASLERIFADHPGDVACVIMEPVGVVEPVPGFLEAVRALTTEQGALLIFDELLTGFRLAVGGAGEHFGVAPDLSCFGKAMANGYPLSAITGPRDLMQLFDEVFFSFTFGGETLSLAAARSTLGELGRGDVIPHLWEQGRRLKDGYNVLAGEFGLAGSTRCVGYPPRTVVEFEPVDGVEARQLKSLFQQECLRRGVLFTGGHNISASHSAVDIDRTLLVYRSVMELVRAAIEDGTVSQSLSGEPVQAVFREP